MIAYLYLLIQAMLVALLASCSSPTEPTDAEKWRAGNGDPVAAAAIDLIRRPDDRRVLIVEFADGSIDSLDLTHLRRGKLVPAGPSTPRPEKDEVMESPWPRDRK